MIFECLQLHAQITMQEVDSIMMSKNFKSKDVKTLSKEIGSLFEKDIHVARAFYVYVVFNTEYDLKEHKDVFKSIWSTPEAEKFKLDQANRCIREKNGVCWDHANLFQQLCQYAGIESMLINGTLRNSDKIPNYPHINHSWNAVKTKTGWKFIDCSIAKKEYDVEYLNAYFLVEPSRFIFNYFPMNKEDQFLTTPVDFDKFRFLNPVSSNFFVYKISEMSPENLVKKRRSSPVQFSFLVNYQTNVNSFEIMRDGMLIQTVSLKNGKVEFSLDIENSDSVEIVVVTDDPSSRNQFVSTLLEYKIE